MTRTVAQVEASFEGLSVAEEETDDLAAESEEPTVDPDLDDALHLRADRLQCRTHPHQN